MAGEEEQSAWYVRRSTTVQGPYSKDDIRRYLLLGRMRLSDRVSTDARCWEPITRCPELIPDEMQDLGSEQGRARFEAARRELDERAVDRDSARAGTEAAPAAGAASHWRRGGLPAVGGIAAVVLLLAGIGYYRDFGDGQRRHADCATAPAADAVWSGCVKDGLRVASDTRLSGLRAINASLRGAGLGEVDLSGARLDYADLTGARLTGADLRQAVLRGANLNGADLGGADLRDADLRNADLRDASLGGARLGGALLGNALWTDGRSCPAGAVGGCGARAER